MPSTVMPIEELVAPATWQTVDCISDLHLQASDAGGVKAFARYLQNTTANALFILGDLFEVWVGDDAVDEPGSFESQCMRLLRKATSVRPIFVMHGNRDFLLGNLFHFAAGTTALADPVVLVLGGHRFVLSHGDALCLEDVDYQRFREQVRGDAWQKNFLARTLDERRTLARGLRDRSEAAQREKSQNLVRARFNTADEPPPSPFADVDPQAARQWLQRAGSATLVHGHTHRPAEHFLGNGLRRVVLSDWDLSAASPRADVLRLSAADGSLVRLDLSDIIT
jgi:UDP-2,3-diacylglucosamine hydrolase